MVIEGVTVYDQLNMSVIKLKISLISFNQVGKFIVKISTTPKRRVIILQRQGLLLFTQRP